MTGDELNSFSVTASCASSAWLENDLTTAFDFSLPTHPIFVFSTVISPDHVSQIILYASSPSRAAGPDGVPLFGTKFLTRGQSRGPIPQKVKRYQASVTLPCCLARSYAVGMLVYRVGAKTLNDTKLERPKSRNSKLSMVKYRKAFITNDFKVSNKNLKTQIYQNEFESKTNVRIIKVTGGEIMN